MLQRSLPITSELLVRVVLTRLDQLFEYRKGKVSCQWVVCRQLLVRSCEIYVIYVPVEHPDHGTGTRGRLSQPQRPKPFVMSGLEGQRQRKCRSQGSKDGEIADLTGEVKRTETDEKWLRIIYRSGRYPREVSFMKMGS